MQWRRWFQQRGKDMEVEMLAQKASGNYWEVHPLSLENLCLAAGDPCMGLL